MLKFIKRLLSRLVVLRSLLLDEEPVIEINGARIQFLKPGDLHLQANRALIQECGLVLTNCGPGFTQDALAAYETGGQAGVTKFADEHASIEEEIEEWLTQGSCECGTE